MGKEWRALLQTSRDASIVWATQQLGVNGVNGEPCASPPYRTSCLTVPLASAGLKAALGSVFPARDGNGDPLVSELQLAFVCLRIRRRLENPGVNNDKASKPRELLAAEVSSLRAVRAAHVRGPLGITVHGWGDA
jgi:hypothetical protein